MRWALVGATLVGCSGQQGTDSLPGNGDREPAPDASADGSTVAPDSGGNDPADPQGLGDHDGSTAPDSGQDRMQPDTGPDQALPQVSVSAIHPSAPLPPPPPGVCEPTHRRINGALPAPVKHRGILTVSLHSLPPNGGQAHRSIQSSGHVDGVHFSGMHGTVEKGRVSPSCVRHVWDLAGAILQANPARTGVASAPRGTGSIEIAVGGGSQTVLAWPNRTPPADPNTAALHTLLGEMEIGYF